MAAVKQFCKTFSNEGDGGKWKNSGRKKHLQIKYAVEFLGVCRSSVYRRVYAISMHHLKTKIQKVVLETWFNEGSHQFGVFKTN